VSNIKAAHRGHGDGGIDGVAWCCIFFHFVCVRRGASRTLTDSPGYPPSHKVSGVPQEMQTQSLFEEYGVHFVCVFISCGRGEGGGG
jgi:hypothetical protein